MTLPLSHLKRLAGDKHNKKHWVKFEEALFMRHDYKLAAFFVLLTCCNLSWQNPYIPHRWGPKRHHLGQERILLNGKKKPVDLCVSGPLSKAGKTGIVYDLCVFHCVFLAGRDCKSSEPGFFPQKYPRVTKRGRLYWLWGEQICCI